MKRTVAAWFTLVVVALAARTVLTARAGSIDSISPASGRAGDVVTIKGNGFGAFNVRVTVGGVPANVLAANGNAVTFRVPPGVAPGTTNVVATNPGGQSGAIAFRLLEGVLLNGPPGALATTAETDMPPRAVGRDDILDGGLLLTRLSLWLKPTATVGQVNAAITRVQGGIVAMRPGDIVLIIAVPRQTSMDGLATLIQVLNGSPGVATALPEREPDSTVLPSGPQLVGAQVFPTRFPAAWNAKGLALRDCDTRKVPILVVDQFIRPAPAPYGDFLHEIPNFLPSPPDETGRATHGYDVTTTLGAQFDEGSPTGANPIASCLDVTGVNVAGLGSAALMERIVRNFPTGRFIINYSLGSPYRCKIAFDVVNNLITCDPTWVKSNVENAATRGQYAARWKALTAGRRSDFLATPAAGNANDPHTTDGLLATIYPGVSLAFPTSFISSSIDGDPFFPFVQDASLWSPHSPTPGMPDLTAQPLDVIQLHDLIVSLHADGIAGADNVAIVGSVSAGNTFGDLHESRFSNFGADLMAVGENVLQMGGGTTQGTSFSAPQVAGLASYLWLLSDDLRRRPDAIAATRTAIQENSRAPNSVSAPVIDAYAAILSLDAATLPAPSTAPVRLSILDVNDDEKFDESDLQIFAAHLLDADGHAVEPPAADYGRYDLNGDGFTGGSRVESFDLERVRSTQYGATVFWPDVTQTIEGKTVHYNEFAVNDLEILCYYAYSALYTGDAAARKELLPGCAGVTVKVQPANVTLLAGATQQFSATVNGSTDPRVSWSTNAPGATISGAGLLTLGGAAGTFTVTATSVADPNAKGTATVIVTAPAPGHGSGSVFARADGSAQFDPNCEKSKSPNDTQTWSRSLNCGGTFETVDHRVFDASAHASITFDETNSVGRLTSATASGTFTTSAHGSKNPDPAFPRELQNNSLAESTGEYELVFPVPTASTVTVQGSLGGNEASIQLQYFCTGAGAIQFGAGPVDLTFNVAAGGSCKFVVLADAEVLALDNTKPQSPNAGFNLRVEVH
jgi:hypothetical protein